MKIERKTITIKKPKKILGTHMIFPITSFGKMTIDSSLFLKDFVIEEVILKVKVRSKLFTGFDFND